MKITIKKHAVFFVFVLLFSMRTVHAAAFSFSGNENGPHDISAAFIFNTKKGIEPNIFYADLLYKYSCSFAEAVAGVQLTSANADILIKGMYIPLNILYHKIGVGTTYHMSGLYNVGTIHDIVAAFEYTLTKPDRFIFFAQAGYMYQWMCTPVPGGKMIVTGQYSKTGAFHCTAIIKKEWYVGGGMSTYEKFRYPVFVTPSIQFDVYYRSKGTLIPEGLYIGLEACLRYSDFFTLTAYPENFLIKSVVGIKL